MSVVYEARNYPIHDGPYPNLGDPEQPDEATGRFPSPPDIDGLPRFGGGGSSMLPDERSLTVEERALIVDDPVSGGDATALDLASPPALPTTMESLLPEPAEDGAELKDDSADGPPSSMRQKGVPKPEREVTKQADGKFYCVFPGCTEEVKKFSRKCEWR